MNIAFGDIILPLWLVVSQWTLLFALSFLIIVMYRQIGYLQQLKDSGSEREGLPLGEKAAAFDYIPANGSTNAPARFDPNGKWSLLLFADPGCVSCQNTLLSVERLAPKLGQAMRVLVVTSAEPTQIAAADAFRNASVQIGRIRSDVATKLYRTTVTPFGYTIDPEGMIRAKGIVGDESAIRRLVRKADRSPVNVEFIVS
jgi:hypothetical protein